MQIYLGLVVILSLLNAVISLPSGKYKHKRNAVSFFSTNSTAAAENQFPYHVAFFKYNPTEESSLFLCSGAIVDESHVITTASAVDYNVTTFNTSNLQIFAGSTNVLGGPTTGEIHIASLKAHPNYTSNSNENDIIVFQVTPSFNFSNAIRPITISTNFTLDTSLNCAISTFADPTGQWDDGVSEYLEWSNISQITCPVEPQPSDSLFCAGNNTSQTTIIRTMDKGSPMVCNSKLVGLVTSSPQKYLTNITKYYDFIFPPSPVTEQPTTEGTPNTTPREVNTAVSDSIFDNTLVRIIVIITVGFIIAIGSFTLIVKFAFLICKK